MGRNDIEQTEERRSGADRREAPRRAEDWRRKIAHTLEICGLVAIAYTGLGWIFGPVLGKRVIGPSVSVDSAQTSDIAALKVSYSRVDEKLSDVRDIVCQIA